MDFGSTQSVCGFSHSFPICCNLMNQENSASIKCSEFQRAPSLISRCAHTRLNYMHKVRATPFYFIFMTKLLMCERRCRCALKTVICAEKLICQIQNSGFYLYDGDFQFPISNYSRRLPVNVSQTGVEFGLDRRCSTFQDPTTKRNKLQGLIGFLE